VKSPSSDAAAPQHPLQTPICLNLRRGSPWSLIQHLTHGFGHIRHDHRPTGKGFNADSLHASIGYFIAEAGAQMGARSMVFVEKRVRAREQPPLRAVGHDDVNFPARFNTGPAG
jgi:hypothetical protein